MPTMDSDLEVRVEGAEEAPAGEMPTPKTDDAEDTATITVVANVLTSDGWHFKRDSERTILRAGAEGENGTYRVVWDIKEDRNVVIIYVFCPTTIPEHSRVKVCEYITRANYGLVIGNFELDMNDGECRYKASIVFGTNGKAQPDMIRSIMGASLQTMDRYFGGLMGVTYGHMEPVDAIREVEEKRRVADAQ